jgi:hypothetical protein
MGSCAQASNRTPTFARVLGPSFALTAEPLRELQSQTSCRRINGGKTSAVHHHHSPDGGRDR